AAIELARRGIEVQVFEKAQVPGGKMREEDTPAGMVDAGPTVFTMRHVFERIFDDAGADLDSEVGLTPCGVLARHAWSESERLDLYADIDQTIDEIGDFA